MRLSLTFTDGLGGAALANFSHNGRGITPSTGEHGFEALTLTVPLSLTESFYYYTRLPNAWCVLSNGAGDVWQGFVEKVGVIADGISITALGTWRCLSRAKYTAMWSTTDISQFKAVTGEVSATFKPVKFQMSGTDVLFIGLKKNETYAANDYGSFRYTVPDDAYPSSSIQGVMYTVEINLPSGFTVLLHGSAGNVVGTGSVERYAVYDTNLDGPHFTLSVLANGASTYTGETGESYAKFTDIRLVYLPDANQYLDDRELVGAVGSTGSQTVEVDDTTGMYVGQKLVIDEGVVSSSEIITLTAVDHGASEITAVFANTHSAAETVRGFVVSPKHIIDALVANVSALSGSYLSDSTLLVEDPEIDLTDEVYEDANPADIITKLAGLGDASGNVWEAGVLDDQLLYFRPRASAGRHWYVDPINLDVLFDLGTLTNSVYAKYRDANGRTLRTTPVENTNSQDTYGVEVQGLVNSNSSLSSIADLMAATALADGATPAPQVGLLVDRLFDASGGQYPNYSARTGDTVTMRSLSPVLSADIDRIRTFRLAGHSYLADDDTLTLVPERPLPSLDRLVARMGEGL